MKLYYGAAIQGTKDRKERVEVNRAIVSHITANDVQVLTEHTTCDSREEVLKELDRRFGPIPKDPTELGIFTRNKMIELVEGSIDAAIFEVSTPSLGTGIEIAHAYLRPRLGLKEIPILALYQKDYWPNKLSIMISGITPAVAPTFRLKEYSSLDEAKSILSSFFSELRNG